VDFLNGLFAADFAFNDIGETLFFSTITGPGVDFTNSEGLWSGHPGSLTLLARTGSQAPGTPSGVMFRNLGRSHLNNRGHSAFRGFLSGPGVSDANRDGIWTDRTGSVELVVRSGTQAPGMPTGISLRSVVYDSLNTADQIAFSGRLVGPGVDDSNDQGIWVEDSGNFRLVVREGSAVPGGASGVVFGETSEVVLNDAGHVALVSGLTGSVVDSTNDGGLWREGASGLELVARRGSQAPGVSAGLNFDVFSSPAFNNLGQVAFEATLSGNGIGSANDAGLWATDPAGVLRLIARAGDPLEVAPGDARIVSDLRLTASIVSGAGVPTGLNNKGQVAFAAMFTDGTSGVFVSNLVAVPEPAELELAVVGFAWLLKQRRKVR
jgi:hypothetical protein